MQIFLLGALAVPKTQIAALLTKARKTSASLVDFPAEIVLSLAAATRFSAHDSLVFLTELESTDRTDIEADGLLRAALNDHGLPYQVLYGGWDHCVAQALASIERHIGLAACTPHLPSSLHASLSAGSWMGMCERCSDHTSEQRLFTGWLATNSPTLIEQSPLAVAAGPDP